MNGFRASLVALFLRDISILLDSEEGGEVELDVSYQVYGANWRPSYDIRVFTNSAKPDEKSAMKVFFIIFYVVFILIVIIL